ncbi:MAG: DUF3047 domain-containing protein [Balneolaceae bacterium]
MTIFHFLIPILFFSFIESAYSQEPHTSLPEIGEGVLLIDDFEDDKIGSLPAKWFDQRATKSTLHFDEEYRNEYKWKVLEEDGNKFLRYEGNRPKHMNFPLAEVKDLNTYDYSILSWKWRPHVLPEGAREDRNSKNDAVASIYVVWEMKRMLFQRVPRSVRYTWSSTLDVGSNPTNLFGNQQILVLRSGEEGLGEWHTFERNIVKDYQDLYGENPPERPLAILIFSDASSTKTWAKNDYDDIILKSQF